MANRADWQPRCSEDGECDQPVAPAVPYAAGQADIERRVPDHTAGVLSRSCEFANYFRLVSNNQALHGPSGARTRVINAHTLTRSEL
jgi:hypothetical protein